jgi:hypothetical protein
MIPKKPAPDLIQGWIPVFGKDHAPTTRLGRDDDFGEIAIPLQ